MKFTAMSMVIELASGMLFAAAAQASGQMAVHEAVPAAKIVRDSPALDAVIAPDAKLEKVATGFIWTEGPMWRKGALWFSDLSGNKMYSLTPNGQLKVLLDKAGGLESFPAGGYGGSNAMVPNKDGTVLMMQHGMRRIVQLDDKLNVKVFLDKYEGQQFNSPNDLVFSADGALYFTDPTVDFVAGAKQETPFQGVYRLDGEGNLQLVTKDLTQPNGLAFSPDGKRFYVDDSEQRNIRVYDADSHGTLTNGRIFGEEPGGKDDGVPDGMKVDKNGNLFVVGPKGIWVWDAKGNHLGTIVTPEQPANLAWGDKDYRTLYITATTSVYRLKTKAQGYVPYLAH